MFLPGESSGQRSLVATVHGVTESQTRLERLSAQARVHVVERTLEKELVLVLLPAMCDPE